MHKLILKHTVLFLMLDTAATVLANTQADSQAHTLFVYASYISHFQANAQADSQAHTLFVYASYISHFQANAQADSQAHTLFVYASYISHFQANPQAHTLFVYASYISHFQANPQAHTLFVYASYISHFQANAQADPQAHTLFMLHTSATFKPTHKLILKHTLCLFIKCFIHQLLSSQHKADPQAICGCPSPGCWPQVQESMRGCEGLGSQSSAASSASSSRSSCWQGGQLQPLSGPQDPSQHWHVSTFMLQ